MTYLDKLEAVVQTRAYREYCDLIAAATVRVVMGDPSAKADLVDLQAEQAQLVRDAVDAS